MMCAEKHWPNLSEKDVFYTQLALELLKKWMEKGEEGLTSACLESRFIFTVLLE